MDFALHSQELEVLLQGSLAEISQKFLSYDAIFFFYNFEVKKKMKLRISLFKEIFWKEFLISAER